MVLFCPCVCSSNTSLSAGALQGFRTPLLSAMENSDAVGIVTTLLASPKVDAAAAPVREPFFEYS